MPSSLTETNEETTTTTELNISSSNSSSPTLNNNINNNINNKSDNSSDDLLNNNKMSNNSTTETTNNNNLLSNTLSNNESSNSISSSIDNSPTNNINPIVPMTDHDLDILIKMERANKEMETNHRSAQSILLSNNSISSGTANNNNSTPPSHSLSRRASFTSCEANSLNNDEIISKMDEISWELWNQIISDWNNWTKKKPSQLKEYIRKGIPIYLRPLAWQYLCGANLTDSKEKYKEYLKKQSACEKIIRRDIDRTYPDHDFFRNSGGQESLFNMMKAYSIHDPEVGYCQGSAFICGLLLIQSIPEEEAFAIFVQIMQHYNLREIYKPNMYHLGLCMFQLDNLLQESLPELHRHFAAHAFHASMYSSSWFLTLFTTSLPLPLVCRIFDVFLNEGFEIIFRVGLALLDFHKDNLMLLDMEGMLKYFQKELPSKHETDHDGLLNRAFAIKYNQKKMKKLEKDFSILKKEEQEEQVEMRRLRAENKLLKQRIDNLEKESANLAERLIKGQVINAQNAECIYVLKNENQKLKDKLNEVQTTNEQNRKKLNEQNNANENELLHEKVNMLLEENSKLRETPDTQRLEEELVQVKMREAEAQLAIKELQKTIHVLNLEYQEFLNNRSAAIASLSATPSSSSNNLNSSQNGANRHQDYQLLEEELLKVKMREAEIQSEMKSVNLKLMQLETEKQVAYNQIKRQDEEIRKLNAQIQQMQEKELENKNQLTEFRRQLDDKEAQLKELNMTHKLQEVEDAHVIAELRQRVASLEVQIQELVTTGQLNDSEKNFYLYNGIAASTDKLVDFNDDMKYLLMSSNTSLQSDKLNFIRTNNKLNGNGLIGLATTTPSTPTTTNAPVNLLSNQSSIENGKNNDVSSSLSSIPNSANLNENKLLLNNKHAAKIAALNRSHSEGSPHFESSRINRILSKTSQSNKGSVPDTPNYVITEYLDSDNEDVLNELDKSYPSSSPLINGKNQSTNSTTTTNTTNASKSLNESNIQQQQKFNNSETVFKTADIDSTLRPPIVNNLSSEHNGDFVKSSNDDEDDQLNVN